MSYNFVAGSFHTRKLCSELATSEVRFYTENGRPFCIFTPPPSGGFGATYDDHLRLIGKRIMDFLLVLIELFSRKKRKKDLSRFLYHTNGHLAQFSEKKNGWW